MASTYFTDQSALNRNSQAEHFAELASPLRILERSERALRIAYQRVQAARSNESGNPVSAVLLEHYPYLRTQIRELKESLSPDYCHKLQIAGAAGASPRIYRICCDALAKSRGHLDTESLAVFFHSLDSDIQLSLAELWAVSLMLKVALLAALATTASSTADGALLDRETAIAVSRFRALEKIRWKVLIESISGLHRTLAEDPAGIYPAMDFETRNDYSHAVEEIAAQNGVSESHVAKLAIKLAAEAASRDDDSRKSHVGYYLIGKGLRHLRRRGKFRVLPRSRMREFATRHPDAAYLGTIALTTGILTALAGCFSIPWYLLALFIIPLSQTAVLLANLGITSFLPPRRLPSLDFSRGIPDDFRAFVVIPTLLLSRQNVQRLLERLEIHYLANRDPNLVFALLTDFADSNSPKSDRALVDFCIQGIRRLNVKHAGFGKAPFYLFHREHHWNPSQGVWMGRERKRGKLEDFNQLLLGQNDAFATKEGDLSLLSSIQFVITLDSDTQLPRDAARKLAGILAHPLNRAVLDHTTKVVCDGYAVLQPRVSIGLESASTSRLARFYSPQAGLDPYTTAVSDVYQDLYGSATYAGKGIYDVRAFHAAVDGRFPDNTLLSHDLIEGEFARVALASRVEVIESYPATYESFWKRKHRWVRGDWQILHWLLPWVPSREGPWVANPLPLRSRWKIFDNLRRSLFEICLASFLVAGVLFTPQHSLAIAIMVISSLLLPAGARAAISLVRLPPIRFWRGHIHETAITFFHAVIEVLLTIVFLPHQAALAADALSRTLCRLFTRRNLLEWECMAQSDEARPTAWDQPRIYLLICAFLALAFTIAVRGRGIAAIALASSWVMAPLVASLLNLPPSHVTGERRGDTQFLRNIALLTWRYFADLSRPEDHWLVPDNLQEDPEAVARRTSPTNIGLQLTGTLAAFDFGYLTLPELGTKLENLFATLDRLERSRGHFYNWYNTRTLDPIPPRFLSTVDSGNLCAALLTLKQACEAMPKQPIVEPSILEGLRDHCLQLRKTIPFSVRSAVLMRLLAALIRQLECRPTDLFFWGGLLRDVQSMSHQLRQHIDWACECLQRAEPNAAEELRYWQDALSARVNHAWDALCALAPWLASPFEEDLRVRGLTPALADLMSSLSRVPQFCELPEAYDRIQNALSKLLDERPPLASGFHDALLKLVYEVESARTRQRKLLSDFCRYAQTASRLAMDSDFSFLVDERQSLLRIGYDAEAGVLADPCYDLLASEARTAVFFAVAKGDAPCEVWFRLGRQLTSFRGWRTLVSWSGTMFEYLMPALFMKTFHRTLLHQSLSAVVKIQHLYGRASGVPWGISEAAFSARDGAQNHQYRAFGVPVIKLDGVANSRLVIAPYATMLALMVERRAAVENLKAMVSRGWVGRFGFFESIEFDGTRSRKRKHPTVIRSFMAHHQGMSLLSLCNVLLDQRMQRRFHADPMVAATELILQERIPAVEEPVELFPELQPAEQPVA